MSYKLFYSYKLLPSLPSRSPSPPLELDSIDEYSELDTNYSYSDSGRNYCRSRRNSIAKLKKNHNLSLILRNDGSDSDESERDDSINTDSYSDIETDHECECKEHEISVKSLTDSLFSSTPIHSQHFIDFDVDSILCDSLQHCSSMRRITEILKLYQCIEDDDMDDIDFMMRMNENVIDDYHHIIIQHLSHKNVDDINDEFNTLHAQLSRVIHCNVSKCFAVQRYHRIREDATTINPLISAELQFYIDLVDTMHCYFIHSFDLGLRIKLNKYYDKKDDIQCRDKWLYLDQQIKTIKRRLNELNVRRNRSKFFTHFDTDLVPMIKAKHYSFGHKYYYWDEFKYNNEHDNGPNKGYLKREWYIAQKYDCLKEEILQNNIYSLDINILHTTIYKASKLLSSSMTKQIKSDHSVFSEYYKVTPNQCMWIDNILSILLYCDYSTLSYYFTSTFRRKETNESNAQLKSRNREYWNWSKILTQTVELFGVTHMNHNDVNIYYHGISYVLFDSFVTHFCAPTSTTRMIEVAAAFAMQHNEEGIILELVKENRYSSLKSFNCEWLSWFGNENEILFIHGERALKFHNIRLLKENEDYFWFMKALRLFHCMINAQKLNECEVECSERDRDQYILPCDYMIIQQLIRNYKHKQCVDEVPLYVDRLFSAFCESKKEICIDLDIINTDYNGIKEYLCSKHCVNLVQIDELCMIFNNCQEIMISGIGNMSDAFMEQLIAIMNGLKHLKHCHLEKVVLFNVVYNNLVLDDGHNVIQRFDGLCDWEFKVEVKYRSQWDPKGTFKIPETSHLVINRGVHIKDDYILNVLNDIDEDDVEHEDVYIESSDSSIIIIDDDFVNEMYHRIQSIN